MAIDHYAREREARIRAKAKKRSPDYVMNPVAKAVYEREHRERGLNRQDIAMALAAQDWGRAATKSFETQVRRGGAQSLMLHANQQDWTPQQRRENIPDYVFKGGDPASHKKPSVRQSVQHAFHTVAVKDALQQGHGITDRGAHERNYANGLAGQIIEKVRDPVDRWRVGNVLERAHAGQMHPRDIQRLGNMVHIEPVVAGARKMDQAGYMPRQRKFKPELRDTIRYLIRQPERRVALNGTVHRVPG